MKFSRVLSALGLVASTLAQSYWYESITHQGLAPYNSGGSSYPVFRNVKSYGAKGDGVTDDTAAIQAAISAGARCAPGIAGGGGCPSSTTSPAVVYFPSGTYLVSRPIVPYYMTQLVGNPNAMATIKATAGFTATAVVAVIDADPYDSSNPDYGTTNVFYRQVKNLVIDTTSYPSGNLIYGIHWPTSQATSLQNMVFKLSSASGTQHKGVFIENGSGGFLTDLVFNGGFQCMSVGSQQFTSRNLTFNNCGTAISQLWDWGWTYMGVTINNCGVGLDISAGGSNSIEVGSVILIDSSINNTPVGVNTATTSNSIPAAAGGLVLENVALNNVPTAVKGPSGTILAGGTTTIAGWAQGHSYNPSGPTYIQGSSTPFTRPSGLLSGSKYYTRSKPSYASYSTSQIKSARSAGAKGDGSTDDTTALQNLINSAASAGNIAYLDAGIYKVTSTISIPSGAIIVGETYPVIMGAGSFFSNINSPKPVIQVGTSGATGHVELSDFIVSTQGATEGATLIEWNLNSPTSNPSGMWDVHTRIGGFTGSNLQVSQCRTTAAQPNAACIAAFGSMTITASATGLYMENVWLWTADHDIDDPNVTQISVYTGRGLSVTSTAGNIWMIGTAVEHHSLYQYQFSSTKNIFAGFIQTETPYYQPSPGATTPFSPVASLNDPDFATFCSGKAASCNDAWGLRVLDSTNILVYGAGLYSFFNNYNTLCSDHNSTIYNEYCQTQIFGIDEGGSSSEHYSGSTVFLYGLSTVGAVSMIDMNGASVAKQSDNTDSYTETIIKFVS